MTRMNRRAAVALVVITAAAVGAVVVACGDDDDETTKTTDAGADVIDAARDASEPDVTIDAAIAEPYCENIDKTALIFCADFEGKTVATSGFDESSVVEPGVGVAAIEVSKEGGVTHTSSIVEIGLQQIGDSGAEAGSAASLSKSLSGNAPNSYLHYEVEMDFRIVGAASLSYVALSVLRFPTGAIKKHGFAVYDGNVFGKIVPKDLAVKDDKYLWHHAKIRLDRPAGSSTASFAVTIDVDGTLVDNIGGADPGATGTPSLDLGAFDIAPSAGGAIRAQFDNVVVRRR